MDWRSLSLRKKIGQTVILMGEPEREKERFGSIEAFLEQYPVDMLFCRRGDHQRCQRR